MIFRLYLIIFFCCCSYSAMTQLVKESTDSSPTTGSMADTTFIDTYLETADRLAFQNPDEAYRYGQKALAIAKKITDYVGIVDAYNVLGYIEVYRGDLEEALAFYELGLKEAEDQNDIQGIVNAYISIATVLSDQNKLIRSLQVYKKALEYVEKGDCNCGEGTIYNNVAGLYMEIDSLEKSKVLFEKALVLFQKNEDDLGIATAYTNLGDYYLRKKNYQEAEDYFNKVLASYRDNNDPETGFFAYLNLGITHTETRNYLSATSYLDSAAFITNSDNSIYHKAILSLERGNLHVHKSEWDIAEPYLTEALELSKKVGLDFLQKDAALALHSVQAENGNYKDAYENLQFVKNISDTLSNTFGSEKMQRVQEGFLLKEEEHARALNAQKSIAQKNRNQFFVALGLLALALLIGTLLFFIYRQKVKSREAVLEQEKLSSQLEVKNKEITSKVMYLARKNELIRNVSGRLAQNQRNLSTSNRKLMQGVIHELKTGEDDDVWREFELRFMEVHQSFYKKMKTEFPTLSQNEMRLCAFLKLNLSTKDIAGITFQSVGSIEVARARLRKKLGIGNTSTNLTEFIHDV